jgi:hypothetical protein
MMSGNLEKTNKHEENTLFIRLKQRMLRTAQQGVNGKSITLLLGNDICNIRGNEEQIKK